MATATAALSWKRDFDSALAEAHSLNKPLLIDFSAAPM
jgi:hypothetical protein